MKREFVGSLWIDTASVMVGDPCQLLSSADQMYLNMERRAADDASEEYSPVYATKDGSPVGSAIVSCTHSRCDGWAWVWIERDKNGEPLRLIVDLSTKVKKAPEVLV